MIALSRSSSSQIMYEAIGESAVSGWVQVTNYHERGRCGHQESRFGVSSVECVSHTNALVKPFPILTPRVLIP